MNKPITIDLFVEDNAQLKFIRPLVERMAEEEKRSPSIQERSVRGGHPRLKSELGTYQVTIERGVLAQPDLVVIGWDANCKGAKARDEVEAVLREPIKSRVVIACPEPHIERWYMIDDRAVATVLGKGASMSGVKCEKAYYKRLLLDTAKAAGQIVLLDGVEFAPDLARSLDWYRAGKADNSFNRFCKDTRAALRQF